MNLTDLDELDNLIISQSREKLNESCDNGESRDESGEKNDTCDVIATELSSLAENFNLTMTSSPRRPRILPQRLEDTPEVVQSSSRISPEPIIEPEIVKNETNTCQPIEPDESSISPSIARSRIDLIVNSNHEDLDKIALGTLV